VKTAYIVSAYKCPEHLGRLLRTLDRGGETAFFVHVDRKSSAATERAMRDSVAEVHDVTFLERHACHWGGFGHVRATLKGIAALTASGFDPDQTILHSGQDYPIKSTATLVQFLEDGDGRSFFMHFPLPTSSWSNGGLDRLRRWHLRYRRLHLQLPLRRELSHGLQPFGGSAYWIVSRDALRTISDFLSANPWYARFFEHVHIPDELFFQTILLNSAVAERCVNFRLHHTEWSRVPAPAILMVEDFPQLVASPCLFARKFDPAVDSRVLDLIDDQLLR
jgi:hypothetical protein